MERYPMFWVGRINIVKMTILPNAIYRLNVTPYQIINGIFTELEQKNFTIHMEIQKTPYIQSSLEKEEWSSRNKPFWIQTTLQSYTHQDSTVLTQKQKYRRIKQERQPRDKPMHLWVPYFWQRRQEYTMGQRQPLQ